MFDFIKTFVESKYLHSRRSLSIEDELLRDQPFHAGTNLRQRCVFVQGDRLLAAASSGNVVNVQACLQEGIDVNSTNQVTA